jgi:metallo-beta-lactamase family protein
MELEFYGAAGQVTGSCHILRINGHTVLLDCGMIQGSRKAERANADPFPFDAGEVDAVVLSHAHIDHSGRLPVLTKRGFRGTIHAQNATRALVAILLDDAADLEHSHVRRENRHRADKGQPLIEPLFERSDKEDAIELMVGHRYEQWFDVVPGVTACYHDAGHIMGSAVVELKLTEGDDERTLVFSGDLGQYDTPILRDPVTPSRADLVLMESTYGDRHHRERSESLVELGAVLEQALEEGGNVLIPAFAVGRSQEILYQLATHYDEWDVGQWQIFLDSPLAIEASDIYWRFYNLFDKEAAEVLRDNHHMPELPNLHLTRSVEESKVIERLKNRAIIIAGSGMCNGGRILHHMKANLHRRETHVLFTGYQPEGTLGRRIIDGAKSIRIYGDRVMIRAKIHTIGGFSAHGDQADLLRWYGGFENQPPVYLVHGDIDAQDVLRKVLKQEGVNVKLALPERRVDLKTLRSRLPD